MKNKVLFLSLAAVACVTGFFSCDMAIPETIAVKTNAVYNYSFGTVSRKLSEYLSTDQLIDSIGKNSGDINFQVYDYNPGKNSESVQQFMMEVPFAEIPVDIGKYLSEMQFAKKIRALSFSQDFSIPEFNMDFQPVIPSELPDFNEILKSKINFPSGKIPVVPGNINNTMPLSLDGLSFNSMTFDDGFLIISIEGTNSPAVNLSFSLGGSSSDMVSVSGNERAFAKIPLNGVTLSNPVSISIAGRCSGVGTVNIGFSLSEDVKFNEITGLTVEDSDNFKIDVSQNVKINAEEVFHSCVVKDGKIHVKTRLPDGWSNVKADSTISISGALDASDSDFVEGRSSSALLEKQLNLVGKTISSGDIRVNAAIKLRLNNSTIKLSSVGYLFTELECSVNSVDSVTVKVLEFSDKLSAEISQDMPEGVKKVIRGMYLKSCGLEGRYKIDLPEGNDFTIRTCSKFLNLGSEDDLKSIVLKSNWEDEFALETDDSVKPVYPNETPAIDFFYQLMLPGFSEDEEYATFRNVEIGQSYGIELDIDIVFDWEKVEIWTSVVEPLEDQIQTGFKIGSIMEGITDVLQDDTFAKSIKLLEIPLYLYAAAPELDVFEDFAFSGIMKIPGKMPEEDIMLVDSEKICSLQGYPKIEKDENDIVTTDLELNPYSVKIDACEILNNDKDDDLKIDYRLGIETKSNKDFLTVTKEDVEDVSIGNISILGRIVIKLKLAFVDTVELDLVKLANLNPNEDLFGRNSPTDIEDFEKYIDVIQKLSILYNIENNMFRPNDSSKVPVFSFISEEHSINEKFILGNNGGSHYFDIETAEVKSILRNAVFAPKMILTIPQSVYSVPRNAELAVKASASLYTEGQVVIF